MSVSAILHYNPNNGAAKSLHDAMQAHAKSTEPVTSSQFFRHQSFSELGIHEKPFNQLICDTIKITTNQCSADAACVRLDTEALALKNIKDVIIHVQALALINHGSDLSSTIDQSLIDVQTVLNTSCDGQYLFGGVNSHIQPCTSDLNAKANIVDSVITTNYTNAAPNIMSIKISDRRHVEIGLDAGNPAFAQVIAALHQMKTRQPDTPLLPGQQRATTSDIDQALKQAKLLIDQLVHNNKSSKIVIAIEKKYNEAATQTIQNMLGSPTFIISPTEVITRSKELATCLKLAASQYAATQEIDKKIVQSIG